MDDATRRLMESHGVDVPAKPSEGRVRPARDGWALFMAGFNESGEGFNGEYVHPTLHEGDALEQRLCPVYEEALAKAGPDDLTRELYEALRLRYSKRHPGESDWKPVADLLARYEREVGDG